MDDGSPDMETSLDMLRMSAAQGVAVQVLTPHYYPWNESIEAFMVRRKASQNRLAARWDGGTPECEVGAEVAYFRGMSAADLHSLCVGGRDVLLVEMPFESWGNDVIDEIATLSLDRGYSVVLAHVERYMSYRGNLERIRNLGKLPLHFQVNAEAFLHFRPRGIVLSLAREGNTLILGSDAHNTTSRKPNLDAAREIIRKKLGTEYLAAADSEAAFLLEGKR